MLMVLCFTKVFIPTAFRTAKTPHSFGHSECNRVKSQSDGRLACNFTSYSTVFCYQDDERMIKKGCMRWNPVYG